MFGEVARGTVKMCVNKKCKIY